MTRTDFVRGYAQRSNLSDEWAGLGIVDAGGKTMFAMPCGCGNRECDGWVMLTGESVLDHLFLNAPDRLREAYRDTVRDAGGE